jgi:hypothetical protein
MGREIQNLRTTSLTPAEDTVKACKADEDFMFCAAVWGLCCKGYASFYEEIARCRQASRDLDARGTSNILGDTQRAGLVQTRLRNFCKAIETKVKSEIVKLEQYKDLATAGRSEDEIKTLTELFLTAVSNKLTKHFRSASAKTHSFSILPGHLLKNLDTWKCMAPSDDVYVDVLPASLRDVGVAASSPRKPWKGPK